MQHLIFDLRDNPGGWVGDAETIGDIFLDKNCSIIHRIVHRRRRSMSQPGADTMPLTVLVNGNSTSASEILAAALRDH